MVGLHETPVGDIAREGDATGDEALLPDFHAGIDAHVDAEAGIAASDEPELREASRERIAVRRREDFAFVEPQIPRHAAGAEGDVLVDDAVANVRRVRPHILPEDGGFHVAAVPDDAVTADARRTDKCVVPDDRAWADRAGAPDACATQDSHTLADVAGSLDHSARVDLRRWIDVVLDTREEVR